MAMAARLHRGQDRVQRVERAEQVDLDDAAGGFGVFDAAIGALAVQHAGIGDQKADGMRRAEAGEKAG